MTINKLMVLYHGSSISLPAWIKFSFEVGGYIHDYRKKNNKSISMLISVPTEMYLSLFIAMGIADKIFSSEKQKQSIRKQVLSLKKGNRIIYQDKESSRKTSVLSVEPSPLFENEMILMIKDGQMSRGVPENQWLDKLILLDEEIDDIKRSRKVSDTKKLGLEGNDLLNKLYSSKNLNQASFYPRNYFYIVGRTTQIEEQMSEKIFTYNDIEGTIGDFIYSDGSNSYTNGKVISSRMKNSKLDLDIYEDAPVIYTDANGYINQSSIFNNNPEVILFSRSDNENKLQEVKEELKRKVLLEGHHIITSDLLNYLESQDVSVPNGIEFIVWRKGH